MAHSHAGHDHVWADDLTRNQELVLGALAHADAPLSAYDILDKLRGDGLRAPLQVYRALEKLTERGLAHRLESLNAFVCCADAHCHRDRQDRLRDLRGVRQGRGIRRTRRSRASSGAGAKATGFVPQRTTIELRGLCKECVASSPA